MEADRLAAMLPPGPGITVFLAVRYRNGRAGAMAVKAMGDPSRITGEAMRQCLSAVLEDRAAKSGGAAAVKLLTIDQFLRAARLA